MNLSITSQILIIGYGNPHRQDDRAGHAVADILREWKESCSIDSLVVTTAYQLDLNMVEDMINADAVIFIDAHLTSYSDTVEVEELKPRRSTNFTTHLFTAHDLVALASQLYATEPRCWLVSLPGSEFDLGEELSQETAEKVHLAADAIKKLIKDTFGE
jgi:hydrogenase maturation protease